MADEKPKTGSITYKQVERAVGKYGGSAREVWEKIGRDIVKSGVPGLDADGDATISTTGLSDAQLARIDALLVKAEETNAEGKEEAAAAKTTKKEK